MDYFSNLKKLNNDNISFNIKNTSYSLVNGLRRIILSEINTLKFRSEPYEKSDINILKNTCCLHNEFLAHRIGMIPINVTNLDDFNTEEYIFKLSVKNTTNQNINVTTKDFKVYFRSDGLEKELTKHNMFPSDPITGEYILICVLKPNITNINDGEEIDVICKSSISNGKENAAYSPVCKSVFYNKIDEKKANIEKQKIQEMKGIDDEEKKSMLTNFNNHEIYRYFQKDEFGEPNSFIFEIETIGVFLPENIFKYAISQLRDKLQLFSININSTSNDIIQINNSDTIIEAVDFKILNEDHTLGNLLQNYIFNLFVRKDKTVKYVGYKEEHPLKNSIYLRIQPNVSKDEDIVEKSKLKITECCDHIISILNLMEKQWILEKSKLPNPDLIEKKEIVVLKKKKNK